jgi:putative Ca2+/H+ antiporter (TMEM165/GDT1 family)
MNNKFIMNAFYAGLVSFSPTLINLVWPNPYLQYGGCLFLIVGIILFYRDYSKSEADKSKLTIGRGTLFGALTGVFLAIFTIANTYI